MSPIAAVSNPKQVVNTSDQDPTRGWLNGMNDPANRHEAEERMRREGRLPPGQSLTYGFPVGQYGPIPVFDPLTWDFRLFGELEEERRWDWAAFNALPRTQVRLDIHCVTRWSKFDTLWEGVSPRQLLDLGII